MRPLGVIRLNIGSDTCLKFARTHLFCQRPTKTVLSKLLETVFICGKLGELKPDLTTTAHFAIQLSYYAMSYLQHSLQSRAGGLFVLVEGVGVDVQRGGGLAVAEDARHRGHIRAPAIIRLAAV